MRRGREIIGLPVVCLDSGKEVGIVRDLVWDPGARRVTHLLVEEKSFFPRAKYLDFREVCAIGEDAVTIPAAFLLKEEAPEGLLASQIPGVAAYTCSGKSLGTLEDLLISPPAGEVAGFELSGGLLGDLLTGRSIVSPHDVVVWGEEAVILRDEIPGSGGQ